MLCKNLPHPECKDDEYYIGNFILRDYEQITLKSKRLGEVSLSSEGVPMKEEADGVFKSYPVFVSKDEVESTRYSDDYWGRVFFEDNTIYSLPPSLIFNKGKF